MEWRVVDRAMRQLARDKAFYDADEASWLVEAVRVRVWVHVGLGSLSEYLERVFGYTPRQVVERMRVAFALESLPRMHRALADGELSWSAVRELSRVANSDTEARWIDAARGKTVRQVEEIVAGHEQGDDPDDEPGPIDHRRQLRYEVSGETFAALRQARQVLELEVGHSLEDDEFLRLLADRASADTPVGTSDRRPRSQLFMTVCEQCGRGTREAAGVAVPVAASSVERAFCDARVLGTQVGSPEKTTLAIPEPTRRYIYQRDQGRCVVPGCRASKYLDIHHIVRRADGGSHDRSNLVLLCNAHHDRVHEGRLRIEGGAPDRLRFLHADGTLYGTLASDHRADVERTLRQLGFDKAASRRAAAASTGDTLEEVIRSALRYAHMDVGLGARGVAPIT